MDTVPVMFVPISFFLLFWFNHFFRDLLHIDVARNVAFP